MFRYSKLSAVVTRRPVGSSSLSRRRSFPVGAVVLSPSVLPICAYGVRGGRVSEPTAREHRARAETLSHPYKSTDALTASNFPFYIFNDKFYLKGVKCALNRL